MSGCDPFTRDFQSKFTNPTGALVWWAKKDHAACSFGPVQAPSDLSFPSTGKSAFVSGDGTDASVPRP